MATDAKLNEMTSFSFHKYLCSTVYRGTLKQALLLFSFTYQISHKKTIRMAAAVLCKDTPGQQSPRFLPDRRMLTNQRNVHHRESAITFQPGIRAQIERPPIDRTAINKFKTASQSVSMPPRRRRYSYENRGEETLEESYVKYPPRRPSRPNQTFLGRSRSASESHITRLRQRRDLPPRMRPPFPDGLPTLNIPNASQGSQTNTNSLPGYNISILNSLDKWERERPLPRQVSKARHSAPAVLSEAGTFSFREDPPSGTNVIWFKNFGDSSEKKTTGSPENSSSSKSFKMSSILGCFRRKSFKRRPGKKYMWRFWKRVTGFWKVKTRQF